MPKDTTVKFVQQLGAIVTDATFVDVIGDLAEAEETNAPLLADAIKDPKAFLESKGVKLPPGATVNITKNSPLGVQVCVDSHCIQVSIGVF